MTADYSKCLAKACQPGVLRSFDCVAGPRDFAFASRLAFHSACSGTYAFYTCLPLVSSHSGRSGPPDFTLVSHLFSILGPGARGSVILRLSPTCLPHLSPALGALGPSCLPLLARLSPSFVSHSQSPWAVTCLPLVSHHFTFVCLPHLPPTLWAACFYMCLQLVLVAALNALGRVILHLSPTLGRVLLHLSPTCLVSLICLPLWELCADFTLVSLACLPHLSPTLSALGRMLLHVSPTLVSYSGACLIFFRPGMCLNYFKFSANEAVFSDADSCEFERHFVSSPGSNKFCEECATTGAEKKPWPGSSTFVSQEKNRTHGTLPK